MSRVFGEPTPVDAITPGERMQIDYLREALDPEFAGELSAWVDRPDVSGSQVFFSEELVERTFRASGRLMSETQQKMRGTSGRQRLDLEAREARIAAVRKQATLVRQTIARRRADASERLEAYKILADFRHRDMAHIRAELRRGRSAEEILAEMRSWREERRRHP